MFVNQKYDYILILEYCQKIVYQRFYVDFGIPTNLTFLIFEKFVVKVFFLHCKNIFFFSGHLTYFDYFVISNAYKLYINKEKNVTLITVTQFINSIHCKA